MTSRNEYSNTRDYIQCRIPFISNPTITYERLFDAIEDLYPRHKIKNAYSIAYLINKTFLGVRIRSIKLDTFISRGQSNVTFAVHIYSEKYKSIGYNYMFDLKSFPLIEVKIQRKVEDIISRSVHSYLEDHSPFATGSEMNPNMFTNISDIHCVCGKRFESMEESNIDFDDADKFTMLQLHHIVKVKRHLRENECITDDNKFAYHNLERRP